MMRSQRGLSEAETGVLSALSESSGRQGERARLILLSAGGRSAEEVAAELGVTIPTVYKWRRRFRELGLAGLRDRARPGQPRRLSPKQRHEIARVTRDELPEVNRRWTIRSLARTLNVTQHQVRAIWAEHDLARFAITPRLLGDAQLDEGRPSLRGLFLAPPICVLALTVDDETSRRSLPVSNVIRPTDSSSLRALYRSAQRASARTEQTAAVADFLAFVAMLRDKLPSKQIQLVFSSGSVYSLGDLVHGLTVRGGVAVHAWSRADAWVESVECWLSHVQSFDSERVAAAQLASAAAAYLDGDGAGAPFSWLRSAGSDALTDVTNHSRAENARSHGLAASRETR
jgi:transposase